MGALGPLPGTRQRTAQRSTAQSSLNCAMSLAFDEYGRPFIIIRDQEGKSRMKVRFE